MFRYKAEFVWKVSSSLPETIILSIRIVSNGRSEGGFRITDRERPVTVEVGDLIDVDLIVLTPQPVGVVRLELRVQPTSDRSRFNLGSLQRKRFYTVWFGYQP